MDAKIESLQAVVNALDRHIESIEKGNEKMTTNQLILSETELHEIEATEAEMNLYIEDEEGQLNVKISKRSWDIIMAAIGFVRDLKEINRDLVERG